MTSFTRKTFHSFYDDSSTLNSDGSYFIRPHATTLEASRTGEPIPRFRQLIKDKQPAVSPLSAFTQSCRVTKSGSVLVTPKPGYGVPFRNTYLGLGTTSSGNNYSPGMMVITPSDVDYFLPISSSLVQSADAEALTRAHSRIQQIQQPVNLQTFVAESHEVKGLLDGPLMKYSKLLIAALANRKQILARAKFKSTDVSSLWLELQFGVIPLIKDIQEIINVFNEKAAQEPVTRVRSYSTASKVVVDSDSNVDAGLQAAVFHCRVRTLATVEVIYHCGVSAKRQDRYFGLNALTNQLADVMNLPATAWELVPWSFLIDYFVNVGDIINATSTAVGSTSYVSRSVIRTLESTGQSSFASFDSSKSWIANIEPTSPVKEYESKCRVVSRQGGQLGIPPVVVTLPGSTKRYANIAALAYQSLTHLKL